jgi:hypothetical protein
MEFYELNRFYDKKLSNYHISYKFDELLYYLYPVVITCGIIVSLIQIMSLVKQGIYITSKLYSLAQSITVFLFQLINIFIFMTNSYELNIFDNKLMNKISSYLNFKIYVNYIFNSLLYIIILFMILNIFDFCMVVIIQPKYDDINFNGNDDEENDDDGRASSISYSCTANDNTAYNNYIENVDSTGCVLQQQTAKGAMTPPKKPALKNLNIQDKLRSTIRRMSSFVKAAKHIVNSQGSKMIDPNDYKKVILINKKESLFSKKSTIRKIIIAAYILSFIFTLPQLFLYNSNRTEIMMNKKLFKNYYKTIQKNDKSDTVMSLSSMGSFVLINLANRSILAKHSDFNLKISTIRFEYCDILNRGYNEFQQSYEMDKSGINSLIDKNINFKNKNTYYNLSIICIKSSEELSKSLTINTLYFWLKHTFSLFIPSLIMIIFLFLIIYVIKNKENFFQNYYYFLNRNNSLENIVTLKTLINRYQLPQEEINLLNREFNFLLIERYNMTIMYLIQCALYFILILPYILFRLVLDLYIKEKIKLNLDFYILYKITFLFFHLNFVISFFMFIFFSFKFRYSLFKAFTCNKELLCCCCCCCNKMLKNGDKNRLLTKLAKFFTSQFTPINKNYSLKSVTDFDVERHKYFMPSNPNNITDDSLIVDSLNINLQATKVLINGEVVINNNDDYHQNNFN